MKLSELVATLIDIWKEKGDCNVHIDLLTENQSNIVNITDVDLIKNEVSIDGEIDDVKQFKKGFK
jgi:hypothetical protein